MSSSAITKFVNTILAAFPPFRWEPEQEEIWIQALTKRLPSFSDDVITKALDTMLGNRDTHKTPTIAECIQACHEAKRLVEHDKGKSELPELDPSSTAQNEPYRAKLADDLVMAPLGKKAAQEGWIAALHAFAKRNARLPQGKEIEDCKKQSKEFDSFYEECVRGGFAGAKDLEKLGAKMIKRRQELTEMVLHGVVR